MNTGGEAAEQIVRMSLEGFEVAARITGAGAKNIAILLYSILKEEQKTKGKARLTNMLRSGKELKVFTVKSGDLKKFTQEAKKYGVLYCVLADRGNKDPNAEVDVIARAEDASKISRIVERFNLASVDAASIVTEAEKSKGAKATIDTNTYGKSSGRSGNYSTNYQISGRELLTPDEVRMLDNRYALLFVRGERPVMDLKYDILKHPNVKLTADGGKPPYIHGEPTQAVATLVFDGDIPMNAVSVEAVSTSYELLSDEDLEEIFNL